MTGPTTSVPAAARRYLLEPGAPGVFVPGQLCALLDRLALDDLRVRERGAVPELDAVLHAIHLAGTSYTTTLAGSGSGTFVDRPPELGPESMSCGVTRASDRLNITTRAVRRAATEGRLAGQQVDGRWRFTPHAIETFRANRAG